MPSLDTFLEHPNSHEKIRQDDYIAGLAKGLALLEAFGTDRQRQCHSSGRTNRY